MVVAGLEIQGFRFSPSGLHLIIVNSCLMWLQPYARGVQLLRLFLLNSRKNISWFLNIKLQVSWKDVFKLLKNLRDGGRVFLWLLKNMLE